MVMRTRRRSRPKGHAVSTSHEAHQFQKEVIRGIEARSYPANFVFGVRLALEEALANALRHGNGENPAKRVWLIYDIGSREVLFVIIDEGKGFDPESVPDPTDSLHLEEPSGRGIFLMRAYMEEVDYRGCGNIVRMRRSREWSPDIA